jgi:hypothetical protein
MALLLFSLMPTFLSPYNTVNIAGRVKCSEGFASAEDTGRRQKRSPVQILVTTSPFISLRKSPIIK